MDISDLVRSILKNRKVGVHDFFRDVFLIFRDVFLKMDPTVKKRRGVRTRRGVRKFRKAKSVGGYENRRGVRILGKKTYPLRFC